MLWLKTFKTDVLLQSPKTGQSETAIFFFDLPLFGGLVIFPRTWLHCWKASFQPFRFRDSEIVLLCSFGRNIFDIRLLWPNILFVGFEWFGCFFRMPIPRVFFSNSVRPVHILRNEPLALFRRYVFVLVLQCLLYSYHWWNIPKHFQTFDWWGIWKTHGSMGPSLPGLSRLPKLNSMLLAYRPRSSR